MQQWRLWASAPDERLLIIDIDERSLADMAGEFGRWPWPRDTLATVLDHAQSQGARALVFDILFSDPDRLYPGGDQALAAAVSASHIGFYPAIRLPARLDARSELAVNRLNGLAVASSQSAQTPPPTVAMVLPFMDAMVRSARLGTHTVQRDPDGKLRRFAFVEALPGGWQLRSMPAAVATAFGVPVDTSNRARPVVWRGMADAYPRVPFSVAWACAEGRQRQDCPKLTGRILLVGASASSLHDVQASPLSNQHAAVDIMATLIDNALNRRFYRDLTPTWRFVLAVAALAAAWSLTWRGSAGATRRALIGLPLLLLAVAYASLHTETVYLDLLLPAGLVLSYLSGIAAVDTCRRRWLGGTAGVGTGAMAVVCGAPASAAEHLERNVFDRAARQRLTVTGGAMAAGDGGRLHAVWVLWGLADAEVAQQLASAVARAVPSAWSTTFRSGADPQREWLQAVASATGQGKGEPPVARELVHVA